MKTFADVADIAYLLSQMECYMEVNSPNTASSCLIFQNYIRKCKVNYCIFLSEMLVFILGFAICAHFRLHGTSTYILVPVTMYS